MCQIQKNPKIMKFQIYRKFVHIMKGGGKKIHKESHFFFKKIKNENI